MLRKEDPALLTGEAKFTDDLAIPGALSMALVRSPYAHARITRVDVSGALGMPGVVAAYSGAGSARLVGRRHALRVAGHPRHEVARALPARDRQGLLRGRRCRGRRRPIERRGARRSRRGHRRLRGAPRGDRPRGRAQRPSRHPRGPRHEQELHVGAPPAGQGGDRRRVRVGRVHGQRAVRPAAAHPDGDGAARRGRRAAAVRQRHHRVLGDADPAPAQAVLRPRARSPRAPGASRRPGRRRRVRLEAERLRGRAAVRRARSQAAGAGAMGRGAHRGRAGDDPGPRADPEDRPRRRRERQGHRGAGRPRRRHGRVPAARHAGHPVARGVPLRRRVRRAELLVQLHVGVHHDDAHRRVSRSRTPRGDVRDRAGDGRAGGEGRRRSGRDPAAQHDQGVAVPVHGDDRSRLRQRRPRSVRSRRRSTCATTTVAAPSRLAVELPARRSTSASASRPTSRCAGWRRAACSRR